MANHILLVEDDRRLAELVKDFLENNEFIVTVESNGNRVQRQCQLLNPTLIILDLMLPGKDGLTICQELRPSYRGPILMLTARNEDIDQVLGLEFGADDYVVKPFSPRELMARVEALLRRSRPSLTGNSLQFADLELDPASHRVRRDGEALHLGPTEFRLLRYFMERPGRVLSRQQILDGVWGMDSDIDERTVDVHIRRLRKAINRPGDADPIRTVRAAGYSMDVN